jgi:ATP diphosphatase
MSQHYNIDTLLTIMTKLRDPENGCPWDLKQTFASIVSHTIEEAYEVADCIEQQQLLELKDELGDLLFQIVFYAQLGKEQQLFEFDDVVSAICDKLIRRHPHVFDNHTKLSTAEINANWEAQKSSERQDKALTSVLDDIPLALPALSRAQKIQKRVASVGFDWPDITGALDKVEEEFGEVREELIKGESTEHLKEELGDLMFALVNVIRHTGFNAEEVLRGANKKFIRRFSQVELHVTQSKPLKEATLEEMETVWQRVKKLEKG